MGRKNYYISVCLNSLDQATTPTPRKKPSQSVQSCPNGFRRIERIGTDFNSAFNPIALCPQPYAKYTYAKIKFLPAAGRRPNNLDRRTRRIGNGFRRIGTDFDLDDLNKKTGCPA